MTMKIIKVLWVGAAFFVLLITFNGYYSAQDKGIWDVLIWLMLILSFPAGLVASLVLGVLEKGFSITSWGSYLSFTLAWSAYFVLGYLQWFKLLPYLIERLRAFKAQQK